MRQTTRRAVALAESIDRVGSTLDDAAELRRAAEIIAANLSELGESATGIDTHAEKLSTGIDELVAILPTLQRLTEIVDPLENTAVRLGRFVDRLPGGSRAKLTQNWVAVRCAETRRFTDRRPA